MKTFRQIAERISNVKDLKGKYSADLEKLSISESSKITLSLIKVKEQSKGVGSKIMTELVEYADSVDKMIVLTPSKDFGGTVPRLIKFYKRFGFVENKSKNKDYEITETMYRMPKLS